MTALLVLNAPLSKVPVRFHAFRSFCLFYPERVNIVSALAPALTLTAAIVEGQTGPVYGAAHV